MECQYCGKEEALPFKCPFCNRHFCVEHRLPENHTCPESWRARAPRVETPTIVVKSKTPYEYEITYRPLRPATKTFWFSITELKHLTLSALLVGGVGLSMVSLRKIPLEIGARPEILIGLATVFIFLFLLHEIAHKLVAQHYGLWAEFRLIMLGAFITLLSVISPIKVISPGAVMIAGSADKDTIGKTAIAGPFANLTISIISLTLSYYLSGPLFLVSVYSAAFNAWIALFNLIPVGMLDGLKVFYWNKVFWSAVFILSIILTILTFPLLP